MRTASWLVVTHYRPRLLEASLAALAASPAPAGWALETVVAYHHGDTGAAEVCERAGVRAIACRHPTCGGKRNVALAHTTGELVMVSDDDEQHAPGRAAAAIAAYEDGYRLTGVREFRYLHLANGLVVRWRGRGEDGLPVSQIGFARNYDRRVLEQVRGWRELPRGTDKDLHTRLQHAPGPRPPKEHDLSHLLGLETVLLQHDANLWGDRPAIPRGVRHRRGDFMLVGEGHWASVPGFPPAVAERLRLAEPASTRPADAPPPPRVERARRRALRSSTAPIPGGEPR